MKYSILSLLFLIVGCYQPPPPQYIPVPSEPIIIEKNPSVIIGGGHGIEINPRPYVRPYVRPYPYAHPYTHPHHNYTHPHHNYPQRPQPQPRR